jgi:3-hydroxyisobutyrate dehydrogenase-like beta-hydroxyacid dehydrogenase
MSTHIGFIGLGAMGLPMAKNLLKAGHTLSVWNRTPEKAQELATLGAQVASTPRGVIEAGGIVISMVAHDSALLDITLGPDGILGALGPDGIHISCSTVAPDTVKTLAEQHEAQGERLLAAPVFGRPDAAAAQKLWILLSGDEGAQKRVTPILEAMGQNVQSLGGQVEAAAALKLAGNFMILSVVESMGEGMLLAERHGVSRQTYAEFFGRSIFACPIYQNYGKQVAERRYRPAGFKLPLGLKDMRLVTRAAEKVGVPMPLADLLKNRLIESLAKNRADIDWTGMELSIADSAGEIRGEEQ